MPIRSRKPIPDYTAHLYPAEHIHAGASFNVENVYGDAFNT